MYSDNRPQENKNELNNFFNLVNWHDYNFSIIKIYII
jgi:hypothetical protein